MQRKDRKMEGRDHELCLGSNQHCWECLRRQLRCDGAHPVCQTCAASGIACPGYEDKQPLRWLAPGQVTSRTWSRKKTKKRKNPLASHPVLDAVAKGDVVPCLSKKVLKVETDDIFEAVKYFNMEIYPPYATILRVSPCHWLAEMPWESVRFLPASIHETLVFMALGHRIASSSGQEGGRPNYVLQTRMYDHRGKAIRAIHRVLDDERLRNTDCALCIVMMLLFGEYRQSVSPTWTQHFEGASKMMALRGGLRTFLGHQQLRGFFDYFILVGVMANTVSPAPMQLMITSQASLADLISEYYGDGIMPILLCPTMLFAEIIRINALRAQAAAQGADLHLQGARVTLQRILAFCPEDWAHQNFSQINDNEHEDERHNNADQKRDDDVARGLWLLLGHIYRSATALYCLASLHAEAPSSEVEAHQREHRRLLVSSLEGALSAPELRLWLMWPVVVAGLEAGSSAMAPDSEGKSDSERASDDEGRDWVAAVRRLVRGGLGRMAGELGTPLPVMAREALERFWARGVGVSGWEECFERPYAFVT